MRDVEQRAHAPADPPPGTEPDPRSGTEPDPRSGTEPDPRSGTEPDPRSGTEPDPRSGTEPVPRSKRWRHGWILELLAGIAVYAGYDWLRDRATGTSAAALHHAEQIVSAEQFLGLYHEHSIQHAFLGADWFMAFWNIYYGTIHFVLPVVALVWLYRSVPARYLLWRNTLLFMLGFALIGFFLYPLTPPRLMPAHYEFVDTAARYFNFGPQVRVTFDAAGQPSAAAVREFGNLFAAMPSLHVGWSTWVALALWPVVRRRWARVLLALYPLTILFCIVVTANHWVLDAVGGWVVLGLGYACARGLAWLGVCRRARVRQELTPAGGTPHR